MAITNTITQDVKRELVRVKGKGFAAPFRGTLSASGVLCVLQNDDDSESVFVERIVLTDAGAEDLYLCTGSKATSTSGVEVTPTNLNANSSAAASAFSTTLVPEGTVGLSGHDSTVAVVLQAMTQAGVLHDIVLDPPVSLGPDKELVVRVGSGANAVIGTLYFARDEINAA
jgi:hypothetical protein